MVVRPAAGGMREHVLALSAGLTTRGHTVEIAAPSGSEMAETARAAGLPVHEIPLVGPLNPVQDFRAAAKIGRLLRAGGYDLVHGHGFKAGMVCRLGVKLSSMVETDAHRRPAVVVTAHNHVLSRDDVSASKKSLYRSVERTLSGLADRYIAVSNSVRTELVEGYGLPADKVITVYNGIDPAPFLAPQDREGARAEFGLPSPSAAVIGLAARFSAQKGLRHLIAAIPEIRDTLRSCGMELVVVIGGSGPLEGELREQAVALGVSGHIRWPGHVDSVPRLLGALDVYVSPAETEALGIALIEAALSGTPTVATRVGGVPEVILDRETGVLVPACDAPALARAVCSLLLDSALADALAASARERCLREFDLARMVVLTCGAYEDACRERGAANC